MPIKLNYILYQMKTKVLVLGGGKSTEHSVSLVSAYNIFHNIPTESYTPLLIAIDKKGVGKLNAAIKLLQSNPRIPARACN